MKKLLIFCLFIGILIASCNKNEELVKNIEIEKYIECPIGEISQITLHGGSGDYEIDIEDPSILEVDYSQNVLAINPKKKGATKVVIYDKITKNMAESNVKTTDAYCAFQIASPVRPPFSSNVYLYLIYNTTKDLYMFNNKLGIIEKGHYLFENLNEKYYLEFSFNTNYNGVDNLRLDLNGNDYAILKLLETEINKHTFTEKTYLGRSVTPTTLNAVNLENGVEYYLVWVNKKMPYHFLD